MEHTIFSMCKVLNFWTYLEHTIFSICKVLKRKESVLYIYIYIQMSIIIDFRSAPLLTPFCRLVELTKTFLELSAHQKGLSDESDRTAVYTVKDFYIYKF